MIEAKRMKDDDALESGRPDLNARLWRVLVRQTDEVAAAMGQGEAAWQDGLAILADVAERTDGAKLRTVAAHARRMDDPAHRRDRRHARAAFRRAARLDAGMVGSR